LLIFCGICDTCCDLLIVVAICLYSFLSAAICWY
jgi:hypothetical protein